MNDPTDSGRAGTIWLLVLMLVLMAGSFFLGRGCRPEPEAPGKPATREADLATLWTCSMHPQIKLKKPGKCPICGMDLVPLTEGGDGAGPRTLTMSESDRKLAEIVTAPVKRDFVSARIRMVGKVAYDETRVKTISAWVAGRIDRMYVDYTGIRVRKGDHLVWLYSPDLLTAQEELLEAKKQVEKSRAGDSEFLRQSNLRSLESAREKLRLLGFDEDQVAAVEKQGRAEDHMLIRAPLGGIVIHKAAKEGDYTRTGTKLYSIADLSRLWVKLDAYESDLPWIRFGQKVKIHAEAHPGETFEGRISFIDPVLDARTRTVKVRVNVANPDGRLKPEMFVRGTVESRIAGGGKVMDPRLAGKWIGPMHPEVVKDAPGSCDVCGMPLVRVEELGLVTAVAQKPLVVPRTAVLRTGRRAVVYVEKKGTDKPTYEGREVILGPRAGDHYIVLAGLREGEQVVVNGSFKIDSALQILAKPSMMSMPGENEAGTNEPPEAREIRAELEPVFGAYFQLHGLLVEDDLSGAVKAFAKLEAAVRSVHMSHFKGPDHELWMELAKRLIEAAEPGAKADAIEKARIRFRTASTLILELERKFGHGGKTVYRLAFCPMAFDNGASWLQTTDEVQNPYLGQDMPGCGEVKER
ncbi:MAG: efflux RND transporter periplasmic adaptor subunit, partial [Planctomycetota bacterium]